MLKTRKRLNQAQFFYKKANETADGKEILYYLTASIDSLRSSLWLLKSEIINNQGEGLFNEWWEKWKNDLGGDKFSQYLVDLRNVLQKERTLELKVSFSPQPIINLPVTKLVKKVKVYTKIKSGRKLEYELKDCHTGEIIPLQGNEVFYFLNAQIGDQRVEVWSVIEYNLWKYGEIIKDAENTFSLVDNPV